MPKYQIQSKANGQVINTDLEADSKDNAIAFYGALSVADILQVKKYLYVKPTDIIKTDKVYNRYATVSISFENSLPIVIKIPALKEGKSYSDIDSFIRNLYRNVVKITVKISSKK